MNALASYLLGAVAIVAIAGGIYQAGKASARRECDAAAVRAELATVRADLDAARAANADAAIRGATIEAEAASAARRVKELEDAEASHPTKDACGVWTGDDARRLRGGSASRPGASR